MLFYFFDSKLVYDKIERRKKELSIDVINIIDVGEEENLFSSSSTFKINTISLLKYLLILLVQMEMVK